MSFGDTIPVREFTDVAALRMHYRSLAARRYEPKPVKPVPQPVIRTIDVATATIEREAREKRAADREWFRKAAPTLPVARPNPETLREVRDWLLIASAELLPVSAYKTGELIAITCQEFGITENEIASQRRFAPLVFARHVSFWLCKRFTCRSFPQIAKRMGDRDHTSIMHGARRIQALVDTMGIVPADDTPSAWAIALRDAARPA